MTDTATITRWRLRELRVTYRSIAGLSPAGPRPTLDNALAVARLLVPLYRDLTVEHAGMLALDTRLRPLSHHLLSRGVHDGTLIHPRELLQAALLADAAKIIVAHNHPSGDPTPSREDRAIFLRLERAADTLGIPLLDFVILGEARAYSLREDREVTF